jgi:hypothetical protein
VTRPPAAGAAPATTADDTAPATRGQAILVGLRRHWLAAGLLAVGLVLRVLVLLAYRPALFYIDTTRYLYDSLGNDPVGYKGPLRAILFVANFNAVAAVQHLLGIGMAVTIYVLLVRRGTSRWLAALAIAPVLLDAYQLQDEQAVMPGTWFQALIVAGLAIALWRPGLSWRRAAVAGLLLGTSATFAQVGEAMILPALLLALAVGGGWRRVAGRAGALIVAFALPIAAYCAGSYLMVGSFSLSHTGITSFYGRTAAAADCATLRVPAAERGMCPDPAQQAQGPDWLEYNQASPVRPFYAHLPRGQADQMLSSFNHSVLTQQPLRLLRAYGQDVLKLYAVTRHTDPGDTPISRWQFQADYPYFTSQTTRAVVLRSVREFGGGTPAVWRPVASFLRGYQLDGGYTPGPLLLLFTLAGLAGPVTLLRRRVRRGQDPALRDLALAGLAFFASAVFVLAVSDLFEFSWRYQLPALVTLAPGGAIGLDLIIRSVGGRRSGPAAAEPAESA